MYSVNNVKTFMGEDFPGYSCNILKNGKKIGTAFEAGMGGEPDLRFASTSEQDEFSAFVAALPEEHFAGDVFPMTPDLYVAHLVDKFSFEKKVKQMSKYKIVFRLIGDNEGEYRTLSTKSKTRKILTKEDVFRARTYLEKMYGTTKIEMIYNEELCAS